MDPCESPDPIFIVDLNELQDDGHSVPVSMDYTLNLGPRVLSSYMRRPAVGDWVRIHSDDDETLYFARVSTQLDERDYLVAIDWETCAPVLNSSWSATTNPLDVSSAVHTRPVENLA
jgi:hypothetical protein